MITLVFDLGGVVIDWEPRRLFSKIFQPDLSRMDYFLKVVCPLEWNELQDAGRPLADAIRERTREFPEWQEEIAIYYRRWEEMIGGRIPGTAELLSDLAAVNVPLFALSNWSRETFPLIERRFPELQLFRRIFLSADFGVAKPSPSIFEWAIHEIGAGKSDLLFIDDNRRNVIAARNVGLPSHLFVNSVELRKALTRSGILLSDS